MSAGLQANATSIPDAHPSLAFFWQYADFDRAGLSNFMEYDGPASDIITGFGQVAHTYYNLAGARLRRL